MKKNSLARKERFAELRKKFFVFCEGRNTEPGYFSAIKHHYDHVEIHIEKDTGHPQTLLSKAVAVIQGQSPFGKSVRFCKKRGDEVWAVFDYDNRPNVMECICRFKSHGIGVAFSDPCFEVWLILHRQDFDRPGDSHSVQCQLSDIDTKYNRRSKNHEDFGEFMALIEVAEGRAQERFARLQSEGSAWSPPCSSVGHLTKALRTAHSASLRGI